MFGYSVVNQKGQVTVPANIRRELDINPDDRVVVIKTSSGVLIKRAPEISALRGSVISNSKTKDFKKMRESFKDYLAKRKNG